MSNTNSTEPQNGNNAGERNNPPPPIGVKVCYKVLSLFVFFHSV